MKPLYFLLFALSPLAAAENIYAPGQAALKFNQWYITTRTQSRHYERVRSLRDHCSN